MKIKALQGLAALALCACSGYGTTVASKPPVAAFSPPPEQQATVCVFRPHAGLGAAVLTPVSDNGEIVGATEGQGYFCYLAEPGNHRIAVDDAVPAKVTVRPGERYYFQHVYARGIDQLMRVDEASARALEAHTRYMILDQAPEGERPPPAIALAKALPSKNVDAPETRVADRPAKPSKTVATKER